MKHQKGSNLNIVRDQSSRYGITNMIRVIDGEIEYQDPAVSESEYDEELDEELDDEDSIPTYQYYRTENFTVGLVFNATGVLCVRFEFCFGEQGDDNVEICLPAVDCRNGLAKLEIFVAREEFPDEEFEDDSHDTKSARQRLL